MTRRRHSCAPAVHLAAAALSLALAAPIRAAQPADCPTWAPDLAGCDRHGRYDGFVKPVTAPYLFEDPFVTTGLYVWGVFHDFPRGSVFQGGDLTVVAVAARFALTDRLAILATKDGWADLDPGLSILGHPEGFTNITLGVKYALIDDPEHQFILTPVLRFETPAGARDVFQGHDEGIWIPGISLAKGFDDLHLIAHVGAEIPNDMASNSTFMFYDLHVDYAVWKYFVPFVSVNAYHYLSGGDGSRKVQTEVGTLSLKQATQALKVQPFEGLDYANLGSDDVGGQFLAILGIGARVPLGRHVSFGGSYEFPVTGRHGIFGHRFTTSLTLEF
jgi:hypothetical protein